MAKHRGKKEIKEKEKKHIIQVEVDDDTFTKLEMLRKEFEYKDYYEWLKNISDEVLVVSKSDGDGADDFYIAQATIQSIFPDMVENISINLENIKKYGKSVAQLWDYGKDKRAICIGAGPSLERNNQLQLLKESNFEGLIITSDRTLIPVLEADIIPNFVVSLDSNKKIAEFYDHDLVRKYLKDIKSVCCVSIHKDVMDILLEYGNKENNLYFTIPYIPPKYLPNAMSIIEMLFQHKIVPTHNCGNTGSYTYFCAEFCRCKEVGLIGLDFAYTLDTYLQQTPYYEDFKKAFNNDRRKIEAAYVRFPHNCILPNYETVTDVVMLGYCRNFLSAIQQNPRMPVWNCNNGEGILCPHKIKGGIAHMKCIRFEDFLTRNHQVVHDE